MQNGTNRAYRSVSLKRIFALSFLKRISVLSFLVLSQKLWRGAAEVGPVELQQATIDDKIRERHNKSVSRERGLGHRGGMI